MNRVDDANRVQEDNPVTTADLSRGDILIVDDTLPNLRLLYEMLKKQGYKVRGVHSGPMALSVVPKAPPDLILLDINMPEMDGYEVCRQLKEDGQTCDIPIIFISALDETLDKVKGFDVGGVDYITKPFQAEEVLARIANHLTIRDLQDKLQQANERLEQRVEERTAQLARTVGALKEQIAERQRAEEGKAELERQLHQAQKMEALGLMAGGMAHDFNNMLTIIMGYAELVLSDQPADEELHRKVELILSTGERAASLTDQLLAFSRRKPAEPRPTDVNAIVRETEKMLGRLIGDNIELTLELAPDPGTVEIDPGLLEQSVVNLALNARDAMPDGGELKIATVAFEVDEVYANGDPDLRTGPYVRLEVRDTGIGMDEETLRRVFEPFFTTKARGKGTGLGLSTVHGIVKQSNGHIQVFSEVGRGTTFRILLPRVGVPVESAPQRSQAATDLRGTETVLVVEDESDLRFMVRRFLEGQGYRVLEAKDGSEALHIYERNKGQVHLLVTDVVMPKMGGQELADWLAPLRPEMKILYMSGYMATEINRRGLLDSGAAFIQKPFSRDALLHKVRETLDDGTA